MKYYGKFNKYQSRKKIKIIYIFPFIFLFLIIFYLTCFSSFFQIKKIEISGNQKVLTEGIKKNIENNFSHKILLFDSKSIFLTDLKKIKDNVLSEYPNIEQVQIFKKIPDKLEILIKERTPVALFEKDGSYFLTDAKGIAFESARDNKSFLLIKKPSITREIKLGESLIDEKEISQILKIEPEFKNRNLEFKIEFAELVNEERLNIKTSDGFEIYFDLLGDISQQVLNLSLVLKEKISSEQRRNLEYIDLRFGNQIYYK